MMKMRYGQAQCTTYSQTKAINNASDSASKPVKVQKDRVGCQSLRKVVMEGQIQEDLHNSFAIIANLMAGIEYQDCARINLLFI